MFLTLEIRMEFVSATRSDILMVRMVSMCFLVKYLLCLNVCNKITN